LILEDILYRFQNWCWCRFYNQCSKCIYYIDW